MKKDRKIRRELLDELLAGYSEGFPRILTGPEGLLKQLTGALVEQALEAELTDHLPGTSSTPSKPGAARAIRAMCSGAKTRFQTELGPVDIDGVPRDREGTFEPRLVKKHQRRFDGFDDKILALYARGMSVRDIQAHAVAEQYGADIRTEPRDRA